MKHEELSWPNPRGLGKVYVRHGHLWTSVGDKRQSTGLVFPERGHAERRRAVAGAIRVLQHRVTEYVSLPTAAVTRTQTVMLYDAIASYTQDNFPEMGRTARSRCRSAFSHFLVNEELGDIALTFDAVKERIVTLRGSCKLASRNRQKVLARLRAFLDYCVNNDWLHRNPLNVLTFARVSREEGDIDRDVPIYTASEMSDVRTWLTDMGYARHREYIEFVELSGNRPIEPLRLRAVDWDGTVLTIMGKKTRDNQNGVRHLVLIEDGQEVCPGLLSLVDRLVGKAHLHDGYLFPWRSLSSIQPVFKACREALGIADGRSLRTYRPTANWCFREVLGWTREFRCAWLGHSPIVNKQHYETKRTRTEMVRATRSRFRSSE